MIIDNIAEDFTHMDWTDISSGDLFIHPAVYNMTLPTLFENNVFKAFKD